jgi:minor extracellular serine protease Vpr
MRVPRRSLPSLIIVVAGAVATALVLSMSAGGREPATGISPDAWRGLVGGERAAVVTGQRSIVILRTPSVAQRLQHVRYATEAQERSWTSQAAAAQQQVLTTLALHGIPVQPEYTYQRVIDGFAAALDPRAVALLEQIPDVVGVYPVRAAYPAAVSQQLLESKSFGPDSGHRPTVSVPGYDGHGVTVALLDTGVDLSHPYLRGKVLPGYDVVNGNVEATAVRDPQDTSQIERHGTELAGLIAGSGGPGGLAGAAPGVTILPIRVAGWQPTAGGGELVYARTDQLIAGLERAVDPNGDGDTHDAVRVALVGVAEPYAAFTDGPEARAARGALTIGTLVVAPAGNDGQAGPSFGSVAGPAAGPAALAVGATDARAATPSVRVVLRKGLNIILDQRLPLVGAVEPTHSVNLQVVAATGEGGGVRFFDRKGFSVVAGRAVIAPVSSDPQATIAAAARAGAGAVVLAGPELPPGGLEGVEDGSTPVVVVPAARAAELLAAQRAGIDVGVSIGPVSNTQNADRGHVAGFSSQGLAFDGSVKPDVVAPGVSLATAIPGASPDASPQYGTINGTSAAAATVAAAAAVLAEMRPSLDAVGLRSLLAGYAQQGRASPFAVGAGTLRLGASAVGEVATDPATIGFGIWGGSHWHATRFVTVRNVSSRRLELSISAVSNGDSEALHFTVSPKRMLVGPGRARRVKITVRAPAKPDADVVTGTIRVAAAGSQTLHVPWALQFVQPKANLLAHVSIDQKSFPPSDTSPAVLSVQAGALVQDHGVEIEPVARLDVLLYRSSGRFVGVLARLRDLLPGNYSFGITGRGPSSVKLPPGGYELRLAAWPTLPNDAKPSRAQVSFTIE